MDSDHIQHLADTPMLDASVRVHLTAAALTGVLASHTDDISLPANERAAELAIGYADAVLKKLAERTATPAAA